RHVGARLVQSQVPRAVRKALWGRRVSGIRAELEAIMGELYDTLAANKSGIKLLDRSARDYPELAALWFESARDGLITLLTKYLEDRTRRKLLRELPDATVTARLLIETAVFWAVHRHWDSHPQAVDEAVARETVVRFVVDALARRERQACTKRGTAKVIPRESLRSTNAHSSSPDRSPRWPGSSRRSLLPCRSARRRHRRSASGTRRAARRRWRSSCAAPSCAAGSCGCARPSTRTGAPSWTGTIPTRVCATGRSRAWRFFADSCRKRTGRGRTDASTIPRAATPTPAGWRSRATIECGCAATSASH